MVKVVSAGLYEDMTFEQTSGKGGSKTGKALLKSISCRAYSKSKDSEIVDFLVYSVNSKTFSVRRLQ